MLPTTSFNREQHWTGKNVVSPWLLMLPSAEPGIGGDFRVFVLRTNVMEEGLFTTFYGQSEQNLTKQEEDKNGDLLDHFDFHGDDYSVSNLVTQVFPLALQGSLQACQTVFSDKPFKQNLSLYGALS